MIVLYTDFGVRGPYVGQMKMVLAEQAPGLPVIDLLHDAPACDPKAASYLLAALIDPFPVDCIFLCVVDPGVGGDRQPGILKAGDRWFVGPDNGLFEGVIRRAEAAGEDLRWWDITWRPERLSTSFHGRDLFAPVAARLAVGEGPSGDSDDGFDERELSGIRRDNWPDDLGQIVYVDDFGNAMTGIRSGQVDRKTSVIIGDQELSYAETFSSAPEGSAFWYENSCGLIEIAVNGGRASDILGLKTGTVISYCI